MSIKFTFRRVPRTGRYRSFQPRHDEVKFNGVVVGDIWQVGNNTLNASLKGQEGKFRVTLYGVGKAPNITFKAVFENEEEARAFLVKNAELIADKYPLKTED